ncbi:MAG: protein-glutamate O-methyltransferase CheR [Syntrophobacteraceae bacterium]
MRKEEIEDIEVKLLLEAIQARYGHDFRDYSRASIKRRLRNHAGKARARYISEMISHLLHDESYFQELIYDLSITVTEMFRDPEFFMAMRQLIVPHLKTHPFVKIWHAGCATGEEVYSLAIILKEEGFYDRATIFATDFNDMALAKAGEGIYPLEKMREFTANYQKAGGVGSFSDYYVTGYDSAILDPALKKNITFANHNLVTDSVFGEMHLIVCRNVLIYFNKTLQDRVLGLFRDSLTSGGILCLGSKESLHSSSIEDEFKTLNQKWKIFRKSLR